MPKNTSNLGILGVHVGENVKNATIIRNAGSSHYFAKTENGSSWAISPKDAFRLTVGQLVQISVADPADQFCKLESILKTPDVFVCIDQTKVQLRYYVGNQTIPEATMHAAQLKTEALSLSKTLQLEQPREPYIASTRLGVTIMCEIPYPNRQLSDFIYQQILTFQKQHKWKISRK